MAKADLAMVGISCGARAYRVAASATRFYAGEPINSLATLTSGAANVNTAVVLTTTKPIIGTDDFLGVASSDAAVNSAGTVLASTFYVDVPIPYATIIRGRAKTAVNVDTDAELLLILGDAVTFDLTASVYTINDTATVNTAGLTIVNGNIARQTLDVTVDARAMRVSIS